MRDRAVFAAAFQRLCAGMHHKPGATELEAYWIALAHLTDAEAVAAMETALKTDVQFFPRPARLLVIAHERRKPAPDRPEMPGCRSCGQVEREHHLVRPDGTGYRRVMIWHTGPCRRYNGVELYGRDKVEDTTPAA